MPVLAAMRHGEAGRIRKTVRSAMYDLGDHCQRFDRARPDARHQQQLREIQRPSIGRSGEAAMQSTQDDVRRPDIVMLGHH